MRRSICPSFAFPLLHQLALDTWIFVILIGGYSVALVVRFTDMFASGIVVLLATGAIILYLCAKNFNSRMYLAWAAIASIAIAPTLLGIYLRHVTAPYEFAHDGMIQVEEAVKFLLAGKNPYAENYLNTPMALWHFSEPNVSINPALYHLAYLPFLIVFSVPFYILSQATIGWFDERMIFLPLFLATLMLLPRLVRSRERLLSLLLIVGLNPLVVPFLAEGRNDVFVLFWVVLSLVMFQADRGVFSAIALAFACATKETAWLVLPFYVILYLAQVRSSSRNAMLSRLIIPLAVFVVVFASLVLPFVFWNSSAFVDGVYSYVAGSTKYMYPIKSLGFGGMALAFGWIGSNTDTFPFGVLQLAFGLPVLYYLCQFQLGDNTLKRLWLCYGLLTFVVAFFSRVFNDNHVGYILMLLALGLVSDV